MKYAFWFWVLIFPVFRSVAGDPAVTDPDKYKVIMENDRVRVLEYRDEPGERTHHHAHPDLVIYAVEPFKRVIHLDNGKNMLREFKAGDVAWIPAQNHVGENVGETPTHAILVELKEKKPATGRGALLKKR